MHHPLRFVVPPFIVLLGVLAIYLLERRHATAKRDRPHDHHEPVGHVTAASVLAGALIVAFIAAFILP